MKRPKSGTYFALVFAACVVAGLWWGFRERPQLVDTEQAVIAPMEVTISEDGTTRVKEIYRVSAPISGQLERSLLSVGDKVVKGKTVVATIRPMPPAFMDERSLREAEAGVAQARAAVALAEADLERAYASLNLAEDSYQRAQRLATSQTIPQAQLDQSFADLKVALAQVASTRAQVDYANAQFVSAQARLIQPTDATNNAKSSGAETCCVQVRAPTDGVVLSLAVESEQVVSAGAMIAELGDPSRIEIVADLLSTDAVKVKPETPARVTDWGGAPVAAVLQSIDPAGFKKVSALGIEEQRVNAVLDLTHPVPGLGHDFQVRVDLVTWRGEDVLQLPLTALFRDGSDWAVYRIVDERAVLTHLELGKINQDSAQVTHGIEVGDTVIIYPSDVIADGVLVNPRDTVKGQ
ncbi:MAG: efflux RND transporter periplasmic adaptor subunit [Brevirhabdus sp.]